MKRKALTALLLLLIAAGVFCFCRYRQEKILPERQTDAAYDEEIALFARIRPQTEESSSVPPLAPAAEVNDAAVGWITIEGTHIDYPIAQAADNDFYLHHTFDGQEAAIGCPFLDYRCAPDFSGFNSIAYAHHMSRQRMFADVSLYREPSFMQQHGTGCLITESGVHPVRFFAYMTVYSTAPAYHTVFVTDAEQQEYLDYIFAEAQYTSGITREALQQTDDLHLLLLSTCTFEYEEARGILIGVIEPPPA